MLLCYVLPERKKKMKLCHEKLLTMEIYIDFFFSFADGDAEAYGLWDFGGAWVMGSDLAAQECQKLRNCRRKRRSR